MGLRVLVLRAAAAGARTAAALAARGHEAVLLAVERIEPTGATPPPVPGGGWAGFLLTSAHAVPALASAFPGDPRPVLAVGPASAESARAAGFPHVEAAAGAVEGPAGLAARVAARGATAGGPWLYAAGQPRRPVLEDELAGAGVAAVAWDVYRTVPVEPPAAEVAAIGHVDGVLLLSGAQADAFSRLAARLPEGATDGWRLLCLSPRIAARLGGARARRAEIGCGGDLPSLFDRLG